MLDFVLVMFIRSGYIVVEQVFGIHRETERKGLIGSKPLKAVVVKAPVGVSLTDAICAPLAMFGGEGVGAVASLAVACASGWRCRRRWCFPSLAAPLLKIGSRVRMSVG